MPVLAWIIVATLVGGILSVVAAAAFALSARPAQVSMLISYAIGTLLGAAFLEILPHAFELSPSAERVSATVLDRHPAVLRAGEAHALAPSPRGPDDAHDSDSHHNHSHQNRATTAASPRW